MRRSRHILSCVRLAVSIHAPTRGATLICWLRSLIWNGFNPRTHEGCDVLLDVECVLVQVSIHAPTRGATLLLTCVLVVVLVSIHAPTRGATQGCGHGGNRGRVSIHAPTRGATTSRTHIICLSSFNPRTHEGCDSTFCC